MTPHERAQAGLEQVKQAIIELLASRPEGLTNGQITKTLGLDSDQFGKHKNYLAWSVCGILMKDDKVERSGKLYLLKK